MVKNLVEAQVCLTFVSESTTHNNIRIDMKKNNKTKADEGKNENPEENSDDLKFIEEFIEQKKSQNKILKEIIEKINMANQQKK